MAQVDSIRVLAEYLDMNYPRWLWYRPQGIIVQWARGQNFVERYLQAWKNLCPEGLSPGAYTRTRRWVLYLLDVIRLETGLDVRLTPNDNLLIVEHTDQDMEAP